jgi:SAM-dependent methyltransferase/DNA-directed RNA polymerase subunit RPC12/RpoP
MRWRVARRLAAAWLADRAQFKYASMPRECPICGYRGMFVSVGHPPRWAARCPECGSRERHRLLHLWAHADGGDRLAGKRILHYAPEKIVMRMMAGNPLYETADLSQSGVTHRVDFQATGLASASYDVVMAHHVLEHIPDDRAAMREMRRLLAPGGVAVLSVPINASRRETYEDPGIEGGAARWAHFSQHDHLRYYGLDFADRLLDSGFSVEIFRLDPSAEARYGLLRDEWLYIARRGDCD